MIHNQQCEHSIWNFSRIARAIVPRFSFVVAIRFDSWIIHPIVAALNAYGASWGANFRFALVCNCDRCHVRTCLQTTWGSWSSGLFVDDEPHTLNDRKSCWNSSRWLQFLLLRQAILLTHSCSHTHCSAESSPRKINDSQKTEIFLDTQRSWNATSEKLSQFRGPLHFCGERHWKLHSPATTPSLENHTEKKPNSSQITCTPTSRPMRFQLKRRRRE